MTPIPPEGRNDTSGSLQNRLGESSINARTQRHHNLEPYRALDYTDPSLGEEQR
ncbi:MAG: hypothetical protein O6700_02150 [Gammaproteobacteria bacterium]|nr:hypothetical protein [Gammaproteobacteria bacterium]